MPVTTTRIGRGRTGAAFRVCEELPEPLLAPSEGTRGDGSPQTPAIHEARGQTTRRAWAPRRLTDLGAALAGLGTLLAATVAVASPWTAWTAWTAWTTRTTHAAPLTPYGVATGRAPRVVRAVAAENFYADVVRQLGGSHVTVVGIISNPSTDPHTYESSTADAEAVSAAGLVVRNGLGYDAFMQKLEAASPRAGRTTIDVGAALGYKTGDNPHLWYDPATMPRVAALVGAQLARLDPADKATFAANLRRFDASLTPWIRHVAALRARYRGAPVAVTEPVFGYAARAIGLTVATPLSFQLAVQEGNDPSPQDVQAEKNLLSGNRVKVFLYNQQAVEPLTVQLLALARARRIPIVGVYESMPPAKTYQTWMEAEIGALDRALGRGISTEKIA